MIIGIDPGINGGVAWDRQGVVGCEKLKPTLPELVEQFKEIIGGADGELGDADGEPIRCFLEEVHAMPKQGVSSVWTFGQGFGRLEAVLYCLGIPTTLVRPQVWQKAIGVVRPSVPKDATPAQKAKAKAEAKNNIKEMVGRAFPMVKPTLATADALGILMYGRKA